MWTLEAEHITYQTKEHYYSTLIANVKEMLENCSHSLGLKHLLLPSYILIETLPDVCLQSIMIFS